jgi:hypothetical protein
MAAPIVLQVDHSWNALFVWPDAGPLAQSTGESTLLLDWQLTALWDAFVECVGDFPERGGTRQFVQFGTALKLRKRQQQQLDFHAGPP